MANKDDYFLILRNNVLYKAKVDLLSGLFAAKTLFNDLSSEIDSISQFLSSTVTDFKDNYYSKSEMQSEFCTKQSISSLTSNSEYVLISEVGARTNELKTINEVDTWHVKEAKHCAGYLLKAYNDIKGIMKKSGNSKAQDYIQQPSVNSVIDEYGNLVEDTKKWEPNG